MWIFLQNLSVFFCSPLLGFISNLTIQRQYFPTDEDQTGAAKALLRLQDTYRLDANTISIGDLPGKGIKKCISVYLAQSFNLYTYILCRESHSK